ncbi:MAG: hypothetical protein Q4E77_07240, partial [Conchiformibius sp.]|nr:hypothetical protein [Conchiformibius sp.]
RKKAAKEAENERKKAAKKAKRRHLTEQFGKHCYVAQSQIEQSLAPYFSLEFHGTPSIKKSDDDFGQEEGQVSGYSGGLGAILGAASGNNSSSLSSNIHEMQKQISELQSQVDNDEEYGQGNPIIGAKDYFGPVLAENWEQSPLQSTIKNLAYVQHQYDAEVTPDIELHYALQDIEECEVLLQEIRELKQAIERTVDAEIDRVIGHG